MFEKCTVLTVLILCSIGFSMSLPFPTSHFRDTRYKEPYREFDWARPIAEKAILTEDFDWARRNTEKAITAEDSDWARPIAEKAITTEDFLDAVGDLRVADIARPFTNALGEQQIKGFENRFTEYMENITPNELNSLRVMATDYTNTGIRTMFFKNPVGLFGNDESSNFQTHLTSSTRKRSGNQLHIPDYRLYSERLFRLVYNVAHFVSLRKQKKILTKTRLKHDRRRSFLDSLASGLIGG